MTALACDRSYWAQQLRCAQTDAHSKSPQLFTTGTKAELLLPKVRLCRYFSRVIARSYTIQQVFAITRVLDGNPAISVAFRQECKRHGLQWTTPKRLDTPLSIMKHIDTFVVCQNAIIDISLANQRDIDGLTLTEWQLLEKLLAVLSVSIVSTQSISKHYLFYPQGFIKTFARLAKLEHVSIYHVVPTLEALIAGLTGITEGGAKVFCRNTKHAALRGLYILNHHLEDHLHDDYARVSVGTSLLKLAYFFTI